MSTDTEPLLKEQMEELHKWFARLYPTHTMKIYTKWNKEKQREEYIVDLFFNATSRSLPFQVPAAALELMDVRVRIKEKWVGFMQSQIIKTIG